MGSLCCGYAGRSYALLDLFKHTGDRHWFFRAIELASRAVEVCSREPKFEYSLFKGSLGAAVLSQDLEEPERALFPLFGAERI
jgi:serine/threonine-protein kinase